MQAFLKQWNDTRTSSRTHGRTYEICQCLYAINTKLSSQPAQTFKTEYQPPTSGCFAVCGIQVREGKNGVFVSMPQRKDTKGEYRDICFPTTAEMRQAINAAVLGEYERTAQRSSLLDALREKPRNPPASAETSKAGTDVRYDEKKGRTCARPFLIRWAVLPYSASFLASRYRQYRFMLMPSRFAWKARR